LKLFQSLGRKALKPRVAAALENSIELGMQCFWVLPLNQKSSNPCDYHLLDDLLHENR
jgi:hypothetical protein